MNFFAESAAAVKGNASIKPSLGRWSGRSGLRQGPGIRVTPGGEGLSVFFQGRSIEAHGVNGGVVPGLEDDLPLGI